MRQPACLIGDGPYTASWFTCEMLTQHPSCKLQARRVAAVLMVVVVTSAPLRCPHQHFTLFSD